MRKENLYHPFEIELKELDHFPKTPRTNNFFELIYIVDGTGVQYINKNRFNYRKGNLFLLTPQDLHSFEVSTVTRFFSCGSMNILCRTTRRKIKRLYSAWSIFCKMPATGRAAF
ncbi:AraC family ligand binding domain-containing protein [Mucilaginibacter aquariorum]|uniref:AraC family ligand binding domain-containing protein n=1 Tax=Mucilaginibacter aquariorum TaxID=2967225 RepID=A0ABT1TA37_9SPHI|nr:AraC family ligand binding domain-containing protein [Mucilaginibacter aquariorum]MCQ6961467.1 AraC family ligand binding domain-containing protein [Mucilaginibacter aquariorum]